MTNKLIIGFITYNENTAKYLPYFLPSLLRQDFTDFGVVAADNSESYDNQNRKYIEKNFPQIELEWSRGNIGYARAYNHLIEKAVDSGAEYFLAINPDMIFTHDFIKLMMEAITADSNIASVAPKIYKWDFADMRITNKIDSCGLKLRSGLCFSDLGQGEEDKKQYDGAEIFGASGAAALYRLSALEKIAEDGRYFDELMFMYKEDCDLAYRLNLAGYKAKLESKALAYHDRSAAGKGESDLAVAANRKNKSMQSKKWSFLNQQIIFIKYWRRQDFKSKMNIIWYELKMLVYAFILESYLLSEFRTLWQIKNKIKRY